MRRGEKSPSESKFVLDGWYKYILAILLGIAIADIAILSIRDTLIPDKVLPQKKSFLPKHKYKSSTPMNYDSIIQRNLLSSNGLMPKIITSDSEDYEGSFGDVDPVASFLPLTLIGTIVHANPQRSVASINLKNKNQILPFTIGETIDKIAQVVSISRRHLVFKNLNNNRLEYIEIKSDAKISYDISKKNKPSNSEVARGIRKTGNKYSINRSVLEQHLNNLPKLLQEARAVPNRDPRSGEINGFRVLDLLPGSLFEKIGIQKLDIITGVNGELVDTPNKAMELFNRLKTSNNVRITVKRDGKEEDLNYSIVE